MAKMIQCKTCGASIAKNATSCPNCGAKNKKKHPILGIILVFIGVMLIFVAIGSSSEETEKGSNVGNYESSSSATSASAADSTPNLTAESEAKDESGGLWSLEQTNAMAAAKRYLSFSAFSHDGLVNQLEFEKYSTDIAVWAADNCGADWNEQALLSAKNYLQHSAFSYTGLINQLEYEKFTAEEATYGADNCAADWNEQAALSAKNYLKHMSFSRQSLIDQLMYEGFTAEQAAYGATEAGY